LEFNDKGHRTRISLGHRDRERASQEADDAAARLGKAEDPKPEEITLGELFDIYLVEVTPRKGDRQRRYEQAASEMFMRYFGRTCKTSALNIRDWERFISDRNHGRVGPASGRKCSVGNRTIQMDLSFLRCVLTWATRAGDGHGGILLDRDPLRGLKLPREKNPRRITLLAEEYQRLLQVGSEVDWRFRVALVLANETGHRIGAVRRLRWSDIDFENVLITWRAESEKSGYAHSTPMSQAAWVILEEARQLKPGIGDAPVLPAVRDPSQPALPYYMRDLWLKAERAAGLERKKGRGWHSLRRKFATELMNEPLKVLCKLGGWRDAETVLNCYQQPEEHTMRAALERRARAVSGN
jgi:integrase